MTHLDAPESLVAAEEADTNRAAAKVDEIRDKLSETVKIVVPMGIDPQLFNAQRKVLDELIEGPAANAEQALMLEGIRGLLDHIADHIKE